MIWLIGPAFTITAVCLAIWPTKNVPEYPNRKVRDWWVIGGLFIGGVLAFRLWWALLNTFVPVGKVMTVVQASGVLDGGARGLERIAYVGLMLILLWQVWYEVVKMPQEHAGDSPPYQIVWRDVVGLSVCALVLYTWAFGIPGATLFQRKHAPPGDEYGPDDYPDDHER